MHIFKSFGEKGGYDRGFYPQVLILKRGINFRNQEDLATLFSIVIIRSAPSIVDSR